MRERTEEEKHGSAMIAPQPAWKHVSLAIWQLGGPRELCIRRVEYVTHIVSMRIFIENPLLTSTKTLVAGVSRASRLATIPSAVEGLAGMSRPADSGSLL
jgi:hypothetical protein